jgi:ribosomal protein S18 acetylase RimI-like enzyme
MTGPLVAGADFIERPALRVAPMTSVIDATATDVPRLSVFLRSAWAEAGPGALGWTGASAASVEEIASEAFLKGLLADAKTKVFAAVDEDRVIGIAVLRHLAEAEDELAGIILVESRTGRGIGRALLEAALERAQKNGTKEMVVRTEASNGRAIRFYQKLGFAIAGRGWEDVQGTKADLVTLRRTLQAPDRAPDGAALPS